MYFICAMETWKRNTEPYHVHYQLLQLPIAHGVAVTGPSAILKDECQNKTQVVDKLVTQREWQLE